MRPLPEVDAARLLDVEVLRLAELDVLRAAEAAVELLRLLLEVAALRLEVAVLRLAELVAGAAVEPRLVVDVAPEGVVVRVVVSEEPDSLTRLLTVVWVVAALEGVLVELDLAAVPVVVVLRVAGAAVEALRLLEEAVDALRLPEVVVVALLAPVEVVAVRLLLVVVAERADEPAAVRAVLLAVDAERAVLLAVRLLLLVTEEASYASRMSRAFAVRLELDATFALRTVNERSGCCLP